MSDKEPSNIFEQASKMIGKRKKKKTKRKRPSSTAGASRSAAPEPQAGEDLGFLEDEALSARYKEVAEKYAEVRDFTSKVFEAAGQSVGEVEAYLHNPANFDEEAWKFLQQRKEEVASELFGSKPSEVKKAVLKRSARGKSKKRRKGKFLGARKGWLKAD